LIEVKFVLRVAPRLFTAAKITRAIPTKPMRWWRMSPGSGPPKGWWTVTRNGIPVRHFPGKDKAERYATDPEYRASLVPRKAGEKAKK
jgi:hypothetical protein